MRKVIVVLTVLLVNPVARGQAAADADPAPTVVQANTLASNSAPPVSVGSTGLIFSTVDGHTTLRVHGYVQVDDRMFTSDLQGRDFDKFLFRRIRPLVEGTLFNALDYRFMPDFGQYNPQIPEAYVELKSLVFAKPRVGKFKEPIGLEVLRSDRELTFAERSLASDLLPLRYMGAQVGGSIFSDSITYSLGYFNGSHDGSNGNFQWIASNEAAARLFFRPFATTRRAAIRQLGIGAAGSSGNQHGTIPGLKTVGQNTFFKYSSGTVANGQHTRISPQAYCYVGPVGVLSEYVISSQVVLNKKTSTTIENEAWQITGSIMLTGEKNTYTGIVPHNSFEPTKGIHHLGAVELAVRYSQVRIDRGAFPFFASATSAAQQAAERGIGVNWYLNRFVKLTADYEHTSFRMAFGNITPLHSENVLMNRVQMAF